ncbi:von Hippel-Lindau disease tumor suppressor-like isoform X2 [Eriocheir sinensis]|uniref:von Hippel-Lindau disease tumor suppressor-like isoform X2 n=1 Tax=Eriocheir sinensis TaxID=95602 RepID=UPI0021C6F7B0|nr:von Hippel-Lindau disease tumor suppressor-like isoform X2 [Eriocheir sinensis]XP_050729911.1 von Hippel-Lindau disease tumor suppressor-like isoform X2 [Eriocheir sinensis]XP_050729913.1 von Hippel-Lindau disease tumor suppressor-like isoform X2 [Eriocheir sinensis]
MADAEQQQQQQQQQHLQQPLRSIISRQQSYVRFVNRTQRSVHVLWVSYQGEHRLYKTLPPGAEYNVNTYVTHPWVFRDAETGATLLVNSEEVFFPKPIFPEGHARYGPVSPYRIPVYISIPLYTLQERAAQVVGSCLQNPKLAYSLDIPKNLMSTIAKWVV